MVALLTLLVVVPIAAWLYAKRFAPQFLATVTGVAFGLVISPMSMGLYGTFFLHPVGIVTGMIGLASGMFHGPPGFHIARYFGLIPPPGIVEGLALFHVEAVNALVWATTYGLIGCVVDRLWRSRVAL